MEAARTAGTWVVNMENGEKQGEGAAEPPTHYLWEEASSVCSKAEKGQPSGCSAFNILI